LLFGFQTMSSPEGMVFLRPRLAWPLLGSNLSSSQIMNHFHPSHWGLSVSRFFCAAASLFPSLLLAHPGHYHPDETDEFDFLRATFFHSHGTLDVVIALIAICSLAVVWFHRKPSVRITALAAALLSLALLPIF
jgi:hypothetical protein